MSAKSLTRSCDGWAIEATTFETFLVGRYWGATFGNWPSEMARYWGLPTPVYRTRALATKAAKEFDGRNKLSYWPRTKCRVVPVTVTVKLRKAEKEGSR
jgi:hypothetical protein